MRVIIQIFLYKMEHGYTAIIYEKWGLVGIWRLASINQQDILYSHQGNIYLVKKYIYGRQVDLTTLFVQQNNKKVIKCSVLLNYTYSIKWSDC